MAKILILGAGIAGHTAASHLRRKLSKEHEVVVVSPNRNYQWVPSNIWVGIGRMKPKDVIFPLLRQKLWWNSCRPNIKSFLFIKSKSN